MGARLYDPQTGRFSSRDSMFGSLQSPLSLNQYVYGGDNPVSMVDRDGMCFRDIDNQTGCGYTMGSWHRYDHTFGRHPWSYMCWRCRALSRIHGIDISVAPPAPPAPPRPTVFATGAQIRAMVQVAQRASNLGAINSDSYFDIAEFKQLQAEAAAAAAETEAAQHHGGLFSESPRVS